jgi:membrane protein involved in colicin uptake
MAMTKRQAAFHRLSHAFKQLDARGGNQAVHVLTALRHVFAGEMLDADAAHEAEVKAKAEAEAAAKAKAEAEALADLKREAAEAAERNRLADEEEAAQAEARKGVA